MATAHPVRHRERVRKIYPPVIQKRGAPQTRTDSPYERGQYGEQVSAIRKERDENGHPTLGIFRPKAIKRLLIEPTSAEWTTEQKAILSQQSLGLDILAPKEELEKIPFDFKYEFVCDDPGCRGHKMMCTDWEIAEAYRKWREEYGEAEWEAKFREKFERDMISKFDTHFFVGTINGHPSTWLIVGLFYPPKASPQPKQHMNDLFG